MLEGARLSKAELIARFGLTSRMAARVGAMLAEKVLLTPAILELAKPGSSMESYLLMPEILDMGHRLSTSRLRELASKSGFGKLFSDTPLVVLRSKTWVTIALAEEAKAEKAWAEEAPEGGRALAVRSVEVSEPEETELASLFTPEELKQLRLTLITSTKVDEKIEAIRKLRFAPISARQRGRLLVGLLGDDSLEVRSEAALALRDLGLSAEVAEAVRNLFMGSDREKAEAALAISKVAVRGEPLEGAVLLVVITGALKEESGLAVERQLIEALAILADQVSGEAAYMEESIKLLVRKAGGRLTELGEPASAAIREMAKHDPRSVGTTLWKLAKDLGGSNAGAFALARLGEIGVPPELAEEFARAVLDQRLRVSELDRHAGELGAILVGLGEVGLRQILGRIEATTGDEAGPLVRLLDNLCQKGRISAGGVKAAGLALLDRLKRARGDEQLALLEVRTLTDHRLPKSLKRDIGREVVRMMSGFLMDRSLDLAEDVLAALGLPALESLQDCLEGEEIGPSKARVLQAVGAVVQDAEHATREELAQVRHLMQACLKGMDEDRAAEGAYAIALGRMAWSPVVDARQAWHIATLLRKKLRDSRQPFKILDGLAWAASNERLSVKAKTEVAEVLLTVFQGEMPESILEERESAEGVVFTVRPEAIAYSEMIPAVVQGLARLCLSIREPSALVERIASVLLRKWQEVSSWQVIWGPSNVSILGNALAAIGSHVALSAETRAQVVKAFSRELGRLSAVRGLGAILELDSGSEEMGELALAIGEELVGVRAEDKFLTPEEREALMATVAVIASRYSLGSAPQRATRFRSKAVALLENALRSGTPGAYESLLRISQSAGLSDFQKSEIQRRLGRFGRIATR